MSRTYEELLAEGRELKIMEERVEAEAGNVRWLWGDLALEVAPLGPDHARNGSEERLRRFYEELDLEQTWQTFRQYRLVAAAWPEDERSTSETWATHMQLMGQHDRFEIIADPVDTETGERAPRWTYRLLQKRLGQKPSPVYHAPPVTPEEKVEAILDLIDDNHKRALVKTIIDPKPAPADRSAPETGVDFDEECAKWVAMAATVLMKGARLIAAAEAEDHAGHNATSEMALTLYRRLAERQLDAEIRTFFESVERAES